MFVTHALLTLNHLVTFWLVSQNGLAKMAWMAKLVAPTWQELWNCCLFLSLSQPTLPGLGLSGDQPGVEGGFHSFRCPPWLTPELPLHPLVGPMWWEAWLLPVFALQPFVQDFVCRITCMVGWWQQSRSGEVACRFQSCSEVVCLVEHYFFGLLTRTSVGYPLSTGMGFKISLWEALRPSGYHGGGLGPLEWSTVSLQSQCILKLLTTSITRSCLYYCWGHGEDEDVCCCCRHRYIFFTLFFLVYLFLHILYIRELDRYHMISNRHRPHLAPFPGLLDRATGSRGRFLGPLARWKLVAAVSCSPGPCGGTVRIVMGYDHDISLWLSWCYLNLILNGLGFFWDKNHHQQLSNGILP